MNSPVWATAFPDLGDNGLVNAKEPSPKPDKRTEQEESLDPNDSEMERDKLRGQTTLHAKPPRLEDEGQPGG